MRYKEISVLEASLENIGVLNDLARIILQQFPDYIPANSKYIMGQAPELQKPKPSIAQKVSNYFKKKQPDATEPAVLGGPIENLDQLIGELIEKYNDYPKVKQALTNFEYKYIVFDNTEEGLTLDFDGLYNWNYIVINLANIKDNADAVDKDVMKQGLAARIKTVLVHEMRHFFQDMNFSAYARSPEAFEKDWNQQAIELDAEWSTTVTEHNVEDWSNPSEYADSVIDQWLHEMHTRGDKRIDDRIINHYRRKTIKYFVQYKDNYIKTALKKSILSNTTHIRQGTNL